MEGAFVAGDELNRNIVHYAREHFGLLVGNRVAEEIKMNIGSAAALSEPAVMPLRGRDLITGLPREVAVNDTQIREALARSVKTILENIKMTLEMTPPELVADIYERGMVLSGGGALLKGLDEAIAKDIQIPVRIADDPMTCVFEDVALFLKKPRSLSNWRFHRQQKIRPLSSTLVRYVAPRSTLGVDFSLEHDRVCRSAHWTRFANHVRKNLTSSALGYASFPLLVISDAVNRQGEISFASRASLAIATASARRTTG